ncbi:ankyrin repeat domain-containing protein 33B [Aplochiton taeniatus]
MDRPGAGGSSSPGLKVQQNGVAPGSVPILSVSGDGEDDSDAGDPGRRRRRRRRRRSVGVGVGEDDVGSMSSDEEDEGGEEEEEEEEEEDRDSGSLHNYWDDDDDDVYQEFEELDFSALPDRDDARSIISDDSFYPPDERLAQGPRQFLCPRPESPVAVSFSKACSNNNAVIVKMMIRAGVTEGEVKETDQNLRSALMIACYQGYVDVVIALSQCPYVDINWQDNEGNTALIQAAQAGHVMITNYLLNYFPRLDMERRNCHGFTAMMKAAMQGRAECVRALMMSGGDVEARDYGRQMTPREWALFTGRYETAYLIERLLAQPCAEQFCSTYRPEWPLLEELVAKATEPKSCWEHLSAAARRCCAFTLSLRTAPLDDGVLDHMVRMTTGLSSPLIAPACHTVCPGSPPCVGKRRFAVQEILRRQRVEELKKLGPERLNNYRSFFQNSRVLLVPRKAERRSSLQPAVLQEVAVAASTVAMRRASLLPLHLMRRSSVRPGVVVPRVMLCKAPAPCYQPEVTSGRRSRSRDQNHLQIPKWRYKEKKEERRAEENKQRPPPLRR